MRPHFQFIANRFTPEDKSGVATWTYDNMWDVEDPKVLKQKFNTFAEAHDINNLIDYAYRAGEAQGYHNLKERILDILI